MSNFTVGALTAAVVVLLLCTDLLPWKIVSRTELDGLQNQVAGARATVAKTATGQAGAWMWDPSNKTMLEKPAGSARHRAEQ